MALERYEPGFVAWAVMDSRTAARGEAGAAGGAGGAGVFGRRGGGEMSVGGFTVGA
jgi:hypothetical protein